MDDSSDFDIESILNQGQEQEFNILSDNEENKLIEDEMNYTIQIEENKYDLDQIEIIKNIINANYTFQIYENQNVQNQNIENEIERNEQEQNTMDKIKNELNISNYQYGKYVQKMKYKEKIKKPTYVKEVTTTITNKSGKTRCTNCNRRYLSLDDASSFESAFYHFTYGKKFSKIIVKELHNNICSKLNLPKMSREEFRSIKKYFIHYKNKSFEIIQEAKNYVNEHPEFIEQIEIDKINNKMKRKN